MIEHVPSCAAEKNRPVRYEVGAEHSVAPTFTPIPGSRLSIGVGMKKLASDWGKQHEH